MPEQNLSKKPYDEEHEMAGLGKDRLEVVRGRINERMGSTRPLTRLAIVREALQGLATLGELEIRLRDNLIHRARRARKGLADIAMTTPHQLALHAHSWAPATGTGFDE